MRVSEEAETNTGMMTTYGVIHDAMAGDISVIHIFIEGAE
jgi:hypothetical protein